MTEKILIWFPCLFIGIIFYILVILIVPFAKDFIYKLKHSKNILNKTKNLMRKLDLPLIPIEFNYNKYNACFKDIPLKIIFGLSYLRNKNTQQINYTICHEVGHYFQCYKFPKWFSKIIETEKEKRITLTNNEEYKNLKLEKNADKLAKIFIKNEHSTI